jgi:hypothetical protein
MRGKYARSVLLRPYSAISERADAVAPAYLQGRLARVNLRGALTITVLTAAFAFAATSVRADRIENGVAVFAALDKVTARTSKFEVPLNQTVQFGALKVTPRVCYSRPPTEQPKTTSFVEVDEIELDGKEKRIFTGWMFAESPGLNAVEHPVFDVWLTDCQKPGDSAAQQSGQPPAETGNAAPDDQPLAPARRRVRR